MPQRSVGLSVVLAFAVAGTAPAQLIPIRTIPIAQGDQFAIFPSHNAGMGGVAIALADSLLEPFVNPAAGVRLGGGRLFSAPTVYGISDGAGGGRTLPLALTLRRGAWFGGFALAVQQVDASHAPTTNNRIVLDAPPPLPRGPLPPPTLVT